MGASPPCRTLPGRGKGVLANHRIEDPRIPPILTSTIQESPRKSRGTRRSTSELPQTTSGIECGGHSNTPWVPTKPSRNQCPSHPRKAASCGRNPHGLSFGHLWSGHDHANSRGVHLQDVPSRSVTRMDQLDNDDDIYSYIYIYTGPKHLSINLQTRSYKITIQNNQAITNTMQDTSSHCHHRSSKMSNARGNPGHAVGTTAIAWRGSMVWQGFRRRWLGPDPAVGHAVCCAVRCKMKGNCWVTVQIEDIVHRRLKEYMRIYIYTQC